ncbi:MAG: hypothetical protein ACK5Q3_14910 [Planctomycetota bacterium]|jgi:hypothetical protein
MNDHHNPPHAPSDSIEDLRFLKAETRTATLDALRGCDCPKCRDVRADDGPECGSLTRAKR